MKKISGIGKWIINGLAGLAGACAGNQVAQADGFEFPAVRTRWEQTTTDTKTTTIETLGLTDRETLGASYPEWFRAYHKNINEGGKTEVDYTVAGVRFPWELGETRNRTTLFGEFGHLLHQGLGIQNETNFGPGTRLTLNYDAKEEPQTRHIGGGLEQKIPMGEDTSLNLGFGLDNVRGEDAQGKDLRKNQAMIHAEWDLDANNQLGAAARHLTIETAGKKTSEVDSLLLLYLHYGPKEKWGTRTWVELSRDSVQETRTFEGDILFAQNPSMPRVCSDTFTRRENDSRYNQSTAEYPFPIERVPLPLRVRNNCSGFAFDLSGKLKEYGTKDVLERMLRFEGAYRFGEIVRGVNPGAGAFYEYSGITGQPAKNSFGGSVVIPITGKRGKGIRWLLEFMGSTTGSYIGVQGSF